VAGKYKVFEAFEGCGALTEVPVCDYLSKAVGSGCPDLG